MPIGRKREFISAAAPSARAEPAAGADDRERGDLRRACEDDRRHQHRGPGRHPDVAREHAERRRQQAAGDRERAPARTPARNPAHAAARLRFRSGCELRPRARVRHLRRRQPRAPRGRDRRSASARGCAPSARRSRSRSARPPRRPRARGSSFRSRRSGAALISSIVCVRAAASITPLDVERVRRRAARSCAPSGARSRRRAGARSRRPCASVISASDIPNDVCTEATTQSSCREQLVVVVERCRR